MNRSIWSVLTHTLPYAISPREAVGFLAAIGEWPLPSRPDEAASDYWVNAAFEDMPAWLGDYLRGSLPAFVIRAMERGA